ESRDEDDVHDNSSLDVRCYEVSDQDSRVGKKGTFCSGIIFYLRRNILGIKEVENGSLKVSRDDEDDVHDNSSLDVRDLSRTQACDAEEATRKKTHMKNIGDEKSKRKPRRLAVDSVAPVPTPENENGVVVFEKRGRVRLPKSVDFVEET
nr:hypothetical protein [Tanacetum cinerariifolium]